MITRTARKSSASAASSHEFDSFCYAYYSPFYFLILFKYFMYIFILQKGKRWKKRRETLTCMRNINWLPLTHAPTRTRPATQSRALTRNRTGDLSVCGLTLKQLSHASQGYSPFKKIIKPIIGQIQNCSHHCPKGCYNIYLI